MFRKQPWCAQPWVSVMRMKSDTPWVPVLGLLLFSCPASHLPSLHPPVHSPASPATFSLICLFFSPPTLLSTHSSISPSAHPPMQSSHIHPSTLPCPYVLSTHSHYPPTHSPMYPSLCPFIHILTSIHLPFYLKLAHPFPQSTRPPS